MKSIMANISKGKIIASLSIFLLAFGNQIALAQAKCTANGREIPCEELGKQVGGVLTGLFGVMIFAAIIGLLLTVFWILMIVHAATKPIENKGMWIVIMVFTGVLGAIVYYFAVKRDFDKQQIISNPPTTPTTPTDSVK